MHTTNSLTTKRIKLAQGFKDWGRQARKEGDLDGGLVATFGSSFW